MIELKTGLKFQRSQTIRDVKIRSQCCKICDTQNVKLRICVYSLVSKSMKILTKKKHIKREEIIKKQKQKLIERERERDLPWVKIYLLLASGLAVGTEIPTRSQIERFTFWVHVFLSVFSLTKQRVFTIPRAVNVMSNFIFFFLFLCFI